MDGLSFADIQSEIVTSGTKGARSKRDIDLHVGILDEAWAAINRWMTATLRQRKGIHIPSLCKITWEFMEGPSDEVRVRPVFILTEAFIRGLRLASFRKPVLPSSCAPCEDLNLSQVAIKYSESLTKDVLFVALRDIVRKFSEHVAAGRSLAVAFQTGKLCAKSRRVWFEFDVSAFADMGGGGGGGAGGGAVGVGAMADDDAFSTDAAEAVAPSVPPLAWDSSSSRSEGGGDAGTAVAAPSTRSSEQMMMRRGGSQRPEQQSGRQEEEEEEAEDAPYNDRYHGGGDANADDGDDVFGGGGGGGQYSSSTAGGGGYGGGSGGGKGEEEEEEEGDEDAIKRALIGGGVGGGDSCLENAFARYIGEMEDDAASVERLNAAISERQTRVYGEADQRRDAHKKQVKELQDFIKTQMAEKKVERDEEGKERMRPITGGPQNLPILTRDAGVAEALNATPAPSDVDESCLTPRSLMVHRMKSKITDGGVRGKGPKSGLSQGQLLASLQGQIGAKDSLRRYRKEADMEEERRYLEHVKAEMHLHSTYSKASELAKQRDLLAAWERDGHLKNLNKLKPLGSKAMKEYVTEVVLNPTTNNERHSGVNNNNNNNSGGSEFSARKTMAMSSMSGKGGGRGGEGTMVATSGAVSARKGMLGVGFDPRNK